MQTQLAYADQEGPNMQAARSTPKAPERSWEETLARVTRWLDSLPPARRREIAQLAAAPPASEREQIAVRVLEFLNEKRADVVPGARGFRVVKSTLAPIHARLKEGATEGELRAVASFKARQVRSGEFSAQYFQPSTLYNGTRFWQYLEHMRAGQ